jgi:hypothetical protein
VLSIESLIYPLSYPKGCHEILNGSIPGIPLIIALSLAVVRIRKRQIQDDRISTLSLDDSSRKTSALALEREKNLTVLLERIEELLNDPNVALESVDKQLEILIARIQNFLLISPYFATPFFDKFYQMVQSKLDSGKFVKVGLVGDFHNSQSLSKNESTLIPILENHLTSERTKIDFIKMKEIEIVIEADCHSFNDKFDHSLSGILISHRERIG